MLMYKVKLLLKRPNKTDVSIPLRYKPMWFVKIRAESVKSRITSGMIDRHRVPSENGRHHDDR